MPESAVARLGRHYHGLSLSAAVQASTRSAIAIYRAAIRKISRRTPEVPDAVGGSECFFGHFTPQRCLKRIHCHCYVAMLSRRRK